MRRVTQFLALAGLGLALGASPSTAADLKKGDPDLKSAGALAFAPDGVLLVGDATGAAVFAIDTGDHPSKSDMGELRIEGIDRKIADMLGTSPQEILINDLAVNPASGKAYLSVARGRGPNAEPVIVRIGRDGKIDAMELKGVPFAKAPLPSPPDPNKQERGRSLRSQAITDLAYVDGRVFVAGLSNEEFASRLLAIPYPFQETAKDGTSLEIYHGAHGRFETRSPVRTFAPYKIKGDSYLMAAYTCTPLVKLPVSELKPGSHVKGTTVAELGNRNTPLDMIVYSKDGSDYILLANNSRGMMKITTEGIDKAEGITQRISDKAGQPYQTIEGMKGVVQLAALDPARALVLVQSDNGLALETVALP